MKTRRRCMLVLLALAALPFSASVALAQDDEEPVERPLRIYVEIDAWGAQPVGLEYEPATQDTGGTAGPEILRYEHEPNVEAYYEAGLVLAEGVGELRASWFGQTENRTLGQEQPGSFGFGQILSHPLFAGFANDGLADGFDSSATTKFSEFRFDFARTAFRSDVISGKWFVGVRRVTHGRDLSATYYALSPALPAILPPQPDLEPLAEDATVSSDYRGRGIEGGMEFHLPIVPKRFEFEAGFALGVLRGKMDSAYSSTNWAYVYDPDADVEGDEIVLGPSYDILGDPDVAAATDQESFTTRLRTESRSTTSPVIDMFIGVRGRVWKELELLLGFRSAYYGDVGVDLRPKSTTATPVGTNFQDVTDVDRSVEYQGGYFGAAFTF